MPNFIKNDSKTVLETINENDSEMLLLPQKITLLELDLSLSEHIYYHYYDDEIYEYFLEKILHEYYDTEITNYQCCNNKKKCSICNNHNLIRYHHKREQKKDYTQIQITIENICLEINVLEIFKRNLCMDLYIRVYYWKSGMENNDIISPEQMKNIQHNLDLMKKELYTRLHVTYL